MFHPGPAALSIYKQNPRNAPLYSTLFPLDLLGFRTKKLYSVTKTQIFPIISSSAIASTWFSRFPLSYA